MDSYEKVTLVLIQMTIIGVLVMTVIGIAVLVALALASNEAGMIVLIAEAAGCIGYNVWETLKD